MMNSENYTANQSQRNLFIIWATFLKGFFFVKLKSCGMSAALKQSKCIHSFTFSKV